MGTPVPWGHLVLWPHGCETKGKGAAQGHPHAGSRAGGQPGRGTHNSPVLCPSDPGGSARPWSFPRITHPCPSLSSFSVGCEHGPWAAGDGQRTQKLNPTFFCCEVKM